MIIKNENRVVGWMVLALLLLCSTASQAQYGEFGLFSYVDNGTSITITGYPESAAGPATIPATINGKPVTNIGQGSFQQCSGLTSVTFPASVTTIGDAAFFGCYSLSGVTIPSNVTSIAGSAFAFSGLAGVTIPATVTTIGGGAFYGCRGLTAINVHSSNAAYSSVNGILYNKNQTILIQCPGAKAGIVNPPSSVTSIGGSAFYFCSELTTIIIPASVTSIGSNAFISCSRVTKITIPSAVTSIGSGAFSSCGSLTEITVHPSNTTYSSVDGMLFNMSQTMLIQCPGGKAGNVNIRASVTSIGSRAFASCSGLTSVSIPAGVTNIGTYAFSSCSSLASVSIPSSVTSIASNTFEYCSGLSSVTILPGVTSIGSNTFQYCGGLTSVTMPATVTSIGDSAFRSCNGLASITIPSSVTSIGNSAFSSCSSLTSIVIPDAVTSIGSFAFSYCWSLTTVTIPLNVTSIGGYAFNSCKALEAITVHPSNTSYISVDGILFNLGQTTLIQCPGGKTGSVTIPSSVTTIGNNAFALCGGLTDIFIPTSVTSIGTGAFSSCDGLTSVTIPASLTSIGSSAFSSCTGLTSVSIPDSVTSIGSYAFQNCISLTSITIPANVTSIGESAFRSCSGLTNVTIPASVTSIESLAFGFCDKLTEITVHPSNSAYSSVDGILFNKSLTSLIKCPGGKAGILTIPSSVTTIGYSAFSACSGLTSITIPSSVTTIGYSAFSSCSGLTSIDIPASVTSIGSLAFSSCGNLTAITVSPANTIFSSVDGILFNKSQTKLIMYPGGKVGSYSVPLSVTIIGDYAFYSSSGLTGVTIHAGVTSIGEGAFSYCIGLTEIFVNPSNSGYSSVDGILFNKSLTNLIHCPDGKVGNVTVPISVMRLGQYAFGPNSGVTSICFLGNTPSENFYAFPDLVTMYYFNAASGFTSPTWGGYPAVDMGTTSPVKPWLIGNGFPYDSDPLSDPNSDGVSLLMAYALNLDPKQILTGSTPRPVMAANQMSLTFYAGSQGITYKVESGTGLESWSTAGVSLSGLDANKFRTATVNMTDPSRFMRLVVTH
ncbi:MAG: leucine-rich repeat protein [Verrucomicrobiota bacterium]